MASRSPFKPLTAALKPSEQGVPVASADPHVVQSWGHAHGLQSLRRLCAEGDTETPVGETHGPLTCLGLMVPGLDP